MPLLRAGIHVRPATARRARVITYANPVEDAINSLTGNVEPGQVSGVYQLPARE